MNTLLASILGPDTQLALPIGLACTFSAALIAVTWRLAKAIHKFTESVNYLRAELRRVWTFRDQERWALSLERENRSRGLKLFVPDVTRAPAEEKEEGKE